MKRIIGISMIVSVVAIAVWSFTSNPMSLAEGPAPTLPTPPKPSIPLPIPVLEPCNGRFCGTDFFGDPEGCCECREGFNSSECCYNKSFCECVKSYWGLWCDTECPCDLQPLPVSVPVDVSAVAGPNVRDILDGEIHNAAAGASVGVTPIQLSELEQTVVQILAGYFTNNAACYLAEGARRGAVLDQPHRAAVAAALVQRGLIGEPDTASKSDSELLEAAWYVGTPGAPCWWGLALGETRIATFWAISADDVEAQSLRRTFGDTGGTTWRSVYQNPVFAAASGAGAGLFAEVLLWVGQEDERGLSTLPYLLRFKYDDGTHVWHPVLMWTPLSSKARLVF